MKDDVRSGPPISQAEEARRQEADWIEQLPVALVTCDGGGRIQALNRSAATLMRALREQILGIPLEKFVQAEDRSLYVDFQCRLGGQALPQACELQMLRADGSTFWARLEASALTDIQGGSIFRIALRDISQCKLAEERLLSDSERYRATLSALSDGLWDWHIPSGQAFFNEQYYAMLGYADQEFPASYNAWRERVHADDLTQAEAVLRRSIEQGQGFELHFRMGTKMGEFRWMSARGKVVDHDPSGASVRMVGTLTDIHTRKRMEMALLDSRLALLRANEELERRVCERTAFLRETVSTLEQEIGRREQKELELSLANQRLGMLTGQLRALAAELTMAEHRERRRLSAILHDHLQPMLASVKLRVAAIGGNDSKSMAKAQQIVKLMNDSLALARSLAAELCPPALHAHGLLAGLEWLVHWMYENYGIRVTFVASRELPPLTEDVGILLFEAVRELLFNAAKHAKVTDVGVSVEQVSEGSLIIRVSDNGVGFDSELVQPSTDATAGFGLFSIRERLNLIGGRLEIASSPGRGSHFTLSAPIRPRLSASH